LKCPRCGIEVSGDYCPSCGLYMKLGQFSFQQVGLRKGLLLRACVSSVAIIVSIVLVVFLRTYSPYIEIVAMLIGFSAVISLITSILALREKEREPWQNYPDARPFSSGERILCTLLQSSHFIIVTEKRFIKLKRKRFRKGYEVKYEVPLAKVDDVTSIRRRTLALSSLLFVISMSLTWFWIASMALKANMLRKDQALLFWLLIILPAFIPTSNTYYALIINGSVDPKSRIPVPVEAMSEYEPVLEYVSSFISCLIEAVRSR